MLEQTNAVGTLLERPRAVPAATVERPARRAVPLRKLPSLRERTRREPRSIHAVGNGTLRACVPVRVREAKLPSEVATGHRTAPTLARPLHRRNRPR